MNLPNSITFARICCVPLFLWILSSSHFNAIQGRQELLAAAVFVVASITDGIDGYLARRLHQVTPLGMLLSSLADKLLVSTAYITLVQFAPALVPGWIAVLIVGREFLVSGLCSVAVQEGMTLRVRDIGKFKTVVQIVSVAAVLLAHAWPVWTVAGSKLAGTDLASGAVWMMLTVSLLSAASYFRAFWMEAVRLSEQRRKPLPFVVKRPGDKNVNAG